MTQEEQIRLYRLMEKLNWFFHQEMHYLDGDIAEQTAQECYPEIREFHRIFCGMICPKRCRSSSWTRRSCNVHNRL